MGRNAFARLRAFQPSLPDFLFLAVLVWLFATGEGGWVSLLADADTGWHIRTGEWILANGRVPVHDLYSFSKPGQPWFAWEWLTDALYAILHGAFGWKGLLLLSACILSAFGVVLFRHIIWKGANPFVALLFCLLSIGASTSHFLARPHTITLLAFTVCMWMIDVDRCKGGNRIWWMIPLVAVWVNLHGGFLGMIACLGLLCVGTAAENYLEGKTNGRHPDYRPAIRYGVLFASCGGATLLNPYGWKLHQHVASYLRSDWIRENIREFLAPRFRSESDLQFEILLFVGLVTVPWLLARRQIVPALWILFWGHNALTTVRHIALYGIVAAPWIALFVSDVVARLTSAASRTSFAGILRQIALDISPACGRNTVWMVVPVVILAILPDARVGWPEDFPKQKFPVVMVARHPDRLSGGRLLTQDQWADYVIYRLYPRQRVFIDGRSDFYGSAIGNDYIAVTQGLPNWQGVLKQYDFDRVLCPVKWPLYSLLRLHPQWRLVDEDGLAALFERLPGTPVPPAQPSPSVEKKASPPSNENPRDSRS
ncbi:MAG: hypothetical protein JNK87_39735 [Bryobacterales bacterium]|nr:hypothetical protein [Bryobacterales bacterium]